MKRFPQFVLLILASLVAAVPCGAAIPAAQRTALIALYNATGGPHWTTHTGWLGPAGTECSWSGVTCDSAATAVIGLMLSNNGLAGNLPSAAGSFPALQSLEAEGNSLTGALPNSPLSGAWFPVQFAQLMADAFPALS